MIPIDLALSMSLKMPRLRFQLSHWSYELWLSPINQDVSAATKCLGRGNLVDI